MVAIFTGTGTGLERSSAFVMGSQGQVGSAGTGRSGEGVYVNAASGNLLISRQDEFLVGVGPDAALSRTYNSRGVGDGDNDDNWQVGAYRKIVGSNGAATITRIDWDGSDTVYEMVGSGLYRTTDGAGAHDTIAWTGTQWLWTDGNSRISDVYDAGGKLLSTSDTDGNSLTYAYNQTSGLLTRVTTSNGEYTDLSYYAGTNRLEKLVTNAGSQLTRVFYTYDGQNRLSTVSVNIDPADNSTIAGANYTTTFTYDGTSKRVASIGQTDGSLLEIGYTQTGSEHRVTRLTQTVASGVTRVTGFFYDLPNRVTTITDALGGVTTMSYDAKGNLTQLVLPVPVPGAAAPTTSFTYTDNGDVASMTENGLATVYEYDANGNMTLSRDSAGNTVRRTYGDKNQLLTDSRFLAPDPDGAGGAAATAPVTARYAYDGENHLRFAVNAEGEVTEYRYDAPGKLLSTIVYPGSAYDVGTLAWNSGIGVDPLVNWVNGIQDKSNVQRTDTTYDLRGNVHIVTRYSAADTAGNGLLSADFSRETYTYSQAGELLNRVSNASTAVEAFLFDGLGRLTSRTDLANSVTTYAFNDAASTTTATLANGLSRVSVYNKAGERITFTESGADIPVAITREYYDGLGRLRMVTDPSARSTYFLYDNASRKVADITADGSVSEFGYDAGNRLVKVVSYFNRLDAQQIALLDDFTAGGDGGSNAGGGGGGGPVGSNLLVNGSFDTSGSYTTLVHGRSNANLPGWSKTNVQDFEQVLSGQLGVTGTDGAYWLDLDSVAGSGATLPIGANLVFNGSFEDSGSYVTLPHGRSNTTLPGWTKANGETFEQISSGQFGVAASQGSYWLDMDSIPVNGYFTTGSNLLTNASFDQSGVYTALPHGRLNTELPGWIKANAEKFEQVASGQFGITASDGAYWLDLDSYVLTGVHLAVGSNLLTNGSFEAIHGGVKVSYGWAANNIPGWTKTGLPRFEVIGNSGFGVQPSDGSFWLDLDSTYTTSSGPPNQVSSPFRPLNLIENGSFEIVSSSATGQSYGVSSFELPGWTVAGGAQLDQMVWGESGIWERQRANSDPNDYWLNLDGPGGAAANLDISQTIPDLTQGQKYLLEFDHANPTGGASGGFEVYWNGELVAFINDTNIAMQTAALEVTGVTGDNVLRFKGVGTADQAGAAIDDVWLNESTGIHNSNTGSGIPELVSGNVEIQQTVAGLTAGQIMEIRFDHANRTTAASGSFEVYWNNVLIASINSTGTTMQTKTYQVAAVAGNNVLRFKGTGTQDNVGASIDKVAVYATEPEVLGGNMDISQTVTGRTAGELLELKFDHANRTTSASGSFEVWWNGAVIDTISSTGAAMQTKTYLVTAIAGNNTLRFKATGAADVLGASIDNIRLLATQPLPTGGNMDISQIVGGLTAGQVMLLEFDHANRTTSASGSFEVWWNNTLVDTITSTGASMQAKAYQVTALAGNNTIRFKGTGTQDAVGASIDNVKLRATTVDVGGGNMDISQTVGGLTAGQVMQLKFDHANRATSASGSFEVWWNNTLVATIADSGAAMQTKTFDLTAIAGNNTLRFKALGTVDGAGASLDNVRLLVTQGPTPPTPGSQGDPLQGLRPTAAPSKDSWTWNVYDTADRLIETINSAGSATVYSYDGASRLSSTTSFANAIAAATVNGFKTSPPTVPVLPSANAATDRRSRQFHDADGRVIALLDAAGGLTRIDYDEAGRKFRETGYAKAAEASLWASGSLASLLSNVGSSASDQRTDFVYDGRGLLRFAIDATARPVEYVYDPAGRVTRTVEYAGTITPAASYSLAYVAAQLSTSGLNALGGNRTARTTYDSAGRAAYMVDPEGAVSSSVYDSVGNLIKRTSFATLYTVSGEQSLATMASWAAGQAANGQNRVSRAIYDVAGRLAYSVDAEGGVTEHQYDAAGRLTKDLRYAARYVVTDGMGKLDVAALIASTPSETATVTYTYDSAGRLTDLADGVNSITHYELDALGQAVNTITAYGSADASTVHREFDSAGRETSETRGYGTTDAATTLFEYDALGNVLRVADWMSETTRTYDQLGQLLSQTRGGSTTSYEYNAFGEVVKTTDGRFNASYTYYDSLGRAVVSRDAESYLTETSYTSFGEVSSVTRRYTQTAATVSTTTIPTSAPHAKDATTSFLYDKLGRVIRTTDAEGFYERYVLDAFGNRTSVYKKSPTSTVADGGLVTNTFDRNGRLLSETLPMTSFNSSGTVVASTVINRFEYDARGNRTRMDEAFGLAEARTTIYVYDKADRLTEIWHPAVAALDDTDFDGTSVVTPKDYFKYDRRGNLIEGVIAANGARTLSYYDDLDRKVAEIDALGTYRAWSYDGVGNVQSARVHGTPVTLPTTPGGTPPSVPSGEVRETVNVYDALNRLSSTSVANIRYGAWNGSAYATSVATLTTSFDYDANGNVIKATDANNNASFAYYDKAGRKTAEVDKEGYLTTWTHNGDGNVLVETRFATRYTGTPTTSAPPSVAIHADDRVTTFTYDRNGRRTEERRFGANASFLDPNANYALVHWGPESVVAYGYNGLGQVTARVHASGESVTTSYDASGRLIQEVGNSYTDHNGASVTPVIKYFYDGLGNLVRSTQGTYGSSSGERVTTYSYGAGGRLAAMTDAAGGTRNYYYDAAGNLLRESYNRLKSDATTSLDAILYTRDLLGRVTLQRVVSWNGGWSGEAQTTAYNAYGEISHRGLNGLWQEQFDYDGAGRLWRTNEGDGVWRYFVHDKAGNRTLAIEDEGDGLAGLTIDQAITAATAGGSVGGAYNDGVNVTISVVDKRGLAIETRQPHRQLSASTIQTLNAGRTYNGFGEVTSETDARGYTVDYKYNTMGRLIEKKSPTVNYTSATGAVASARPTETYYYDREGRLIATTDANSNLARRRYLAGTGLNGTEGLVTHEYHADGGVLRNFYDVFGDLRTARNELGGITPGVYDSVAYNSLSDELRGYDGVGRLISQTHRGNLLTDLYAYDLLGNRLKHWNNVPTLADYETTDYDAQGRIVSQRAFGGDVTTTSYAWDNNLATSGMGATYGGWMETTTHVNGLYSVEKSDRFDRIVYRRDLGGHTHSFAYDMAGRVTTETGGLGVTYTWLNTGRAASATTMTGTFASQNWTRKTAGYGYDATGNLTAETLVEDGEIYYQFWHNPQEPDWYYESFSRGYKNATASYDALNRLTTWDEAGSADMAAASIDYEYDLNSNIRHATVERRTLDSNGAMGSPITSHEYYLYDPMNRVARDKGWLNGSTIGGGTVYSYDKAGRRMTADDGASSESYAYNNDGTLASVSTVQGGLKASFSHDALGRQTRQQDWLQNGWDAGYDRQIVYNAEGQIASETVASKQGSVLTTSYVTNTYGSGTSDLLGAALSVSTSDYRNGGWEYTTTANGYAWYDGAVLDSLTFQRNVGGTITTHSSDYVLNGEGQLASVSIVDGRSRNVRFVNDMTGQTIRRDEKDNNQNAGDPHEIWYRYGGKEFGFTGNNGTLETNYTASIANRTAAAAGTGAFRNGAATGTAAHELDPSLRRINSYGQGSEGGSYTVRAGDTLQSIAAAVWGDASLWYKLAEANGLTNMAALSEGRQLTLPAGVQANGHNAGTFRPYDAGDVLGETSPVNPTPKARKGNKCGAFGAILLVVVAVAVTAITAGAAVAALSPAVSGIGAGITAFATGATAAGTALGAGTLIAAGAIGGAAGSIASQGLGVATGLQDNFSWKGVALAGLSGGIGGGLGLAMPGTGFVAGAVRGVVGSVATQGIAVATGLQSKFDWAGVAAAGFGGGVGAHLGRNVPSLAVNRSLGNILSHAGVSAASAIANGAARSLINGTSFGDNVLAALPDAIGSTIGNALAGAMATRSSNSGILGDIEVTSNGGGSAVMLPEDLRNDPQLRALAGAVPRNLAELRAQYRAAMVQSNGKTDDLNTANARLETARATLAAATDPREIRSLTRRIAGLEARAHGATVALERATRTEGLRATAFTTAQGHLTALQNFLIGRSITVQNGATIESYSIRGPNPEGGYRSMDAAAVDAIALSWAVVRATGRSIEYAGFIYEDSPGIFSYDQRIRVGRGSQERAVDIALSSGDSDSATFLPQDRNRREVGMFHIHPRNAVLDSDANRFFGPGDLYASQQLSRSEGRDLAHYLGASDGAILLLPNPRDSTLPVAPEYIASRNSTHVTPPQSAYRNIRSPGYFPTR